MILVGFDGALTGRPLFCHPAMALTLNPQPRFKRLTAEEREELEQMKTSRFDNKEPQKITRDLKLTYCLMVQKSGLHQLIW